MKNMSIGIKMTISFALVIVMFLIASIVTLKNTKQLGEDYDKVNHTHEVLEKIELVLGDLKDAETGQRGFIITGLENYLDPYNSALKSVRKNISDLELLTIDSDFQQQQIIKLDSLVTNKLDELETTIYKRRTSFEAAKKIVLSEEGKVFMDDIRSVMIEMTNHENKLLKERETSSEQDTNNANIITIWITIGVFVIIILLILYGIRIVAFPIRNLSLIAKQIAVGDLTGEITKTDRKDEIGVLANSFKLMQQYMREKATQANQIAEGNLSIEVKPISNKDTMGVAFALMLDNLFSHRTKQQQNIRVIDQKEKYLRTILNNAVNGIIIINHKGIIETFNLAAHNIFGYTADEVIGKNVSLLANELDRKQHDSYLSNYLKTRIPKIIGLNREVIGIRKDGSPFPLRLGVSEIVIQDRTVFMGTITDLTKEKESEKVLNEIEERFQKTFDQAPVSIANTDTNGKFQKVNHSFCTLFGYTEKEMLKMSFGDITFPDDIKKSKSKMHQLINGEIPDFSLEKRYNKKNGELIWGNVTVSILKDKSGDIQNLIVIIVDITLRKTTEDDLKNRSKDLEISNIALEKSKSAALSILQDAHSQRERAENALNKLELSYVELNKLNQAIEQSTATIIITDKSGVMEYVNPAFTKISGYTFEEAVGHKPGLLKSGKHSKEFYKNMWDTILAGKTWRGDLINKTKDGEEFVESASISPMFDTKGGITHFVGVKEDISDRKRLEEELIKSKEQAEQANKAKSTFLANMSHEIRTPMNAILGFSEILSKRIKDQSQLDYLNSIQASGKTLLDLINNILDLSKIESGKMEFSYEPSNIKILIQDIVRMFEVKTNDKNLKLNAIISEELPNILYIEELRIKQILINLINNSIKFTEKGYIEIEAFAKKKSDDYIDLIMKVKDTGIGIPGKYHKKVFQAFDQMDNQDSKKYEGTGLGLAITQQLVKQMNGRIELESEVGKGSIFTITLEKVKISRDEILIEERTEFDPDTIQFEESTVLIADDIKTNRDVLKGYLSDYKINIIEAKDGQETINALEKYKPDLVFLDLRMPVMDGYETNEIIMKNPEWSQIPIIAITASAFDKDEKKVLSLGFSGYIRKPASLNDILKLLMKFLKHTIIAKDEEVFNEITSETIDKPEEVLLEINKRAMPVWEEINKIRSKKNIFLFAEILIEIGENYKSTSLIRYGKELLSASKLFNIEKEKNLIQQFPDFVKNLNPSSYGK